MTLVSKSIPALINGVSQQAAATRLNSQVEIMENCVASVVDGLQRRPPTRHLAKLGVGGSTYTSAFTHAVQRDSLERYEVIVLDGELEVYDLFTGAKATVSFPNGKGYLAAPDPRAQFKAVTVGDYTFLVNTGIRAAMAAIKTPVRTPEGLVFVRAASYAETMTLYVNGPGGSHYWQISLPQVPTAGGDANKYAIFTPYVAGSLYAYMTSGSPSGGHTGGSSGTTATALGYTVQVSGSLIYITRADGADFSVSTTDGEGEQHLKAIKGKIQKLSDLPKKGWPEFTIEVTGDSESDSNPYWVKFSQGNTSGYWKEVAKPDTFTSFNAATMPHVLISTSASTFTFKEATWDIREAGDDTTIPVPSFIGQFINDIFFLRGRLGFLAGQNTITSRSGAKQFNFWREKATRVLDTDPIDIAVTHTQVSLLRHAVPFNEDLILFSDKTQFRLGAAGDTLSPNTVEVKPISELDSNISVKPVVAGLSLFFAKTREGFTGIEEFLIRGDTKTALSQPITEHVPTYIPGDAVRLAASSNERFIAVLCKSQPWSLFVYSYFVSGQEKVQSAWSKWTFPYGSTVLDMSFFGSNLEVTLLRTDGLYLEYLRLAPVEIDESNFYAVHLDRRLNQDQVTKVYSSVNKTTTITLPYAHNFATGESITVVPKEADKTKGIPEVYTDTLLSTTTLVLPGNWTARAFFVGIEYYSWAELSEQYMKQETGRGSRPVLEGRLQLRRMRVLHNKTAALAAAVVHKRAPWEFGEDGPIVIDPNPDQPIIDPKPDGDPDDPDIEIIDLSAKVDAAWEALKTFDVTASGDPRISVDYISPVEKDDPNRRVEILSDIPVNPSINMTQVIGVTGPNSRSISGTISGAGPAANLRVVTLVLSDHFYYINTVTPDGSGNYTSSVPFYYGGSIWCILRDISQPLGDKSLGVPAPTIFYENFNPESGRMIHAVNDTGTPIKSVIDLGFYEVLNGAVRGIPNIGTGTSAWPQNSSYGLSLGGFSSISGPDVNNTTGTIGIGGGKFAYTTDFRVVTFDASGARVGSGDFVIDGTAPSSAPISIGVPFVAGGFAMLQRKSTGGWVTTIAVDTGAYPPGQSAAATLATTGSSSVTTPDTNYRVFLFARTDATYFIGNPPRSTSEYFEWPENPSGGLKSAELWYSPNGIWPAPESYNFGIEELGDVRDKLALIPGTTLIDQFYAGDPEDGYRDPTYTGPVRAKVNGVIMDGTYEAQLFSVGDIVDPASKQVRDIVAPGEVFWSQSYPGVKIIRIVHKATGKIVFEFSLGVGLVRSYRIPEATTDPLIYRALVDRCYVYDQAVAIIAACIQDDEDRAVRWVKGLLATQAPNGNFPFSVNRISGIAPDPYYRGGASWWCVEALAFFAVKYPGNELLADLTPSGMKARIFKACDHLITDYLVTTVGNPQKDMFRGGRGRYAADYSSFDPDYIIPWVSLEHNVDAYFALRRVDVAFTRPDYLAIATAQGTAMINGLWIEDEGRLAQGLTPDASAPSGYIQDRGGALDLNSWGAMFLVAAGRLDLARLTLRWTEKFRWSNGVAEGYTPYLPNLSGDGSYAGVTPGVWSEGTFGVILARRVLGEEYKAIVEYAKLSVLLGPYGYPYTTDPDVTYELQAWESVAGTGWAVITADPQGFWESLIPPIGTFVDIPGTTDPTAGGTGVTIIQDPLTRVVLDKLAPNVYRMETSGKQASYISKSGVFRFPIHAKSTRAAIRLSSQGHLPFSINSIEWDAYRVGRTKRVT